MYVTLVLVEHFSHTNEPDKAVNVDPSCMQLSRIMYVAINTFFCQAD